MLASGKYQAKSPNAMVNELTNNTHWAFLNAILFEKEAKKIQRLDYYKAHMSKKLNKKVPERKNLEYETKNTKNNNMLNSQKMKPELSHNQINL